MKKISDFNSATEKYPVVYAGSATRPEYVDMPTILQQQEGVAPLDTLPAQWWNAMWKLATRDINAFRDYVGDSITEINNLLTKFNITLDDADSEQLYDFFHDDYVQNYLSTIFVNKTGDTIDGDLHVKGDLSVDGIGEEIISTELKVGANTITLRNDNPSALGTTELAGVVTENYDGNNHNNIISVDKNGEARTGDIDIATRVLYSNDGTNFYTDEELTTPATIGASEEVRDTGNQTSGGVEIYEGVTYSNNDTQPLLTRAESNALIGGHILVWDAIHKRAVDGGALVAPIIDRIYPVGTIYWTSKNVNPGVTFGVGTWVQIKDRFILAAGDTYNNGVTGGSATVTLTTQQIPSHTHTFTGTAVTSGANNRGHTHSVTASGSISGGAYKFTGIEVTSGGMSANVVHSHTHYLSSNYTSLGSPLYYSSGCQSTGGYSGNQSSSEANLEHTHKVTAQGTISVTTNPSFTGSSVTSSEESQNHTHSVTASGTNSSTGGGQAHNNMPPYIVKYCWERTA